MNEQDSPTLAVSLTVKNGAEALDFYTRAFGAKELYRMPTPEGCIAHAEFQIGDTRVYLSDEAPEWHARAMPKGAQASCLFSILTDNCDEAFKRAVEAGGEVLNEPEDHYWGMRSGMILDPFGYRWTLAQVIEDVSSEEIQRRAEALFSAEGRS